VETLQNIYLTVLQTIAIKQTHSFLWYL